MRIVLLCLVGSLCLSGCSTYSTRFEYGAAKGGNGLMMDEIDALIDSGEIEKYTKSEVLKQSKRRQQEANVITPKLPSLKITRQLSHNDDDFVSSKEADDVR